MSISYGPKVTNATNPIMVSAANGDTYGDAARQQFRMFQTLIQPNVKSMALTTPPVSPSNGDTYVVGVGGTGAWASQDNYVAYWTTDDPNVPLGKWEFYTPVNGWHVYNQATSLEMLWNGTTWVGSSSGVTGTANQVAISAGGILSLPASVIFPAAFSPKKTVLTATGSTTINPALGNSFRVNLNNVATVVVTISNGVTDGQEVTLLYVQGGATGSAVSYAGNVKGATTPSAGLNTVSTQRFSWDATATNWYALNTGVTAM